MNIKQLNEKLVKFVEDKYQNEFESKEDKFYFVSLNGERVSDYYTNKAAAIEWAEENYSIDDDRIAIEDCEDEEQVDEAYKQKNEGVHFGQPNVDKCYNELMDISFQEMKKRNGKELSDKEFEAFRPTLLKKYPKEVVDYCYMKANEDFKTQEPAQKNQSLDVQALKEYLSKENSRVLNIAYNDDFTESNRSYYKGKATAIHKIQTKFNL